MRLYSTLKLVRISPRNESSDSIRLLGLRRMLISLSLLWRQQAFSTLPLRVYPKHLSPHLPIRSLCSRSSSMAQPVASSASLQIPALESQHTGAVSNKEPKPQKEKKSKTVPASQSPLEVRCHATVIACYLTHYSSHQLQPSPGFFEHRVKIFESLRAEYDAFVQGLFLPPHTGIKAHNCQHNRVRKLLLRYPMAPSAKAQAGRPVRWMLRRAYPRVCLKSSSSPRC
jgi:hypothetical protein